MTLGMKWLTRRFRTIALSSDVQALLQAAAERARLYDHDYVGVEHVFLSAWALPDTHPGHQLIGGMPIDVPVFISELETYSRVITGRLVPAVLPRTPRLMHVIREARNLARLSDAPEVTVCHLLGAMAWEGNSAVSYMLRKHVRRVSKLQKEQAAGGMFLALTCFPGVHLFDPKEVPGQDPGSTAATGPGSS
jgi:ATP-dependent Clp protease ATP-binding subunit ClpA